jgi:hypothetical protein
MTSFENFSDIENWLREQWSGLFRDLLNKRKNQKEISELSEQVVMLKETNSTLKNYLESIIRKIEPDSSENIIKNEDERIRERKLINAVDNNHLTHFIIHNTDLKSADIKNLILDSKDFSSFRLKIRKSSKLTNRNLDFLEILSDDAERPSADFYELKTELEDIINS